MMPEGPPDVTSLDTKKSESKILKKLQIFLFQFFQFFSEFWFSWVTPGVVHNPDVDPFEMAKRGNSGGGYRWTLPP